MTVKELISKLLKIDQKLRVSINMDGVDIPGQDVDDIEERKEYGYVLISGIKSEES